MIVALLNQPHGVGKMTLVWRCTPPASGLTGLGTSP